MTLLLLAVLTSMGYAGFVAIRASTEGVAAGPLLAAAQLEARRLTDDSGEFPSGVVADLVAVSDSSLGFSSGAASSSTVSVYRVDGSSLVLAAVSGPDCLVLLDRPGGASTWALFVAVPSCSAAGLAGEVSGLPSGGSSASPQEVTGG